jgi:pantoate--beta-alanine ligase
MTKQLNLPIEIVSCPIMREESGLALSSRNMLLSDEERKKATKISQALFKSTTFVPAKSVEEIKAFVTESLSSDPIFRMEYFEIVDGDTLQSVKSWDDASYVVGCITIYCGKIRLIDNVVYKK